MSPVLHSQNRIRFFKTIKGKDLRHKVTSYKDFPISTPYESRQRIPQIVPFLKTLNAERILLYKCLQLFTPKILNNLSKLVKFTFLQHKVTSPKDVFMLSRYEWRQSTLKQRDILIKLYTQTKFSSKHASSYSPTKSSAIFNTRKSMSAFPRHKITSPKDFPKRTLYEWRQPIP